MSTLTDLIYWAHKNVIGEKAYSAQDDSLRRAPVWFKMAERIRRSEAISANHSIYGITGDSIMYGFGGLQDQLERRMGGAVDNSSIPGDSAGWHLDRMQLNILPRRHKRVLLGLCGNNFIRGHSINHVIKKLSLILAVYKAADIQVMLAEIIPLPDVKGAAELNQLTAAFNRSIGSIGLPVLKVRKALEGPGGFIRPEYEAGDRLHISRQAYEDHYLRPAANFFMAGKL